MNDRQRRSAWTLIAVLVMVGAAGLAYYDYFRLAGLHLSVPFPRH